MKKFVFIVVFLMVGYHSIAISTGKINENLVRSFRETYPDAVSVTWRETEASYAVYFTDHDVRVQLVFDKEGNFISSNRYYSEGHLPYYLVSLVRQKFPAKRIYGVTEISSKSRVRYYLKLEDDKTWMTVEMNSRGNIRIMEKFEKA